MPLFTPQIQVRRRRFTQAAMRWVFRRPRPSQARGTLARTGIHKILVCRTVHTLGDSLTLTPLLQELGATYPGAEVDIINGCAAAQSIYGQFFFVRRIFQLPAHAVRHPLRTFRAIRAMQQRQYDLVIDPDPESQSGRLLTLLARATNSLGFCGPKKSGRLTDEVAIPAEPRHKGTLPVYLLRSATGEPVGQREYPGLDIRVSPAERRLGRETLARLNTRQGNPAANKGSIGVYAYATGNKNFGPDWWNRFLRVLEPAVAQYSLIEILPALGYSPLESRYPGFFSSDVRKMAAVMANLRWYISADCGVMHLASAARTPTVGIFSVTPLDEWGPYGGGNRAIDARDMTPEQVAQRVLEWMRIPGVPLAEEMSVKEADGAVLFGSPCCAGSGMPEAS